MKKKIQSYALFAFIFLLFLGLLFAINARITPHLSGGGEFRVAWQGTRNFLFEQKDPYSVKAAEAIQEEFYGRPAREGEYPYRLDLPLYMLFLYLPFALLEDFHLARALWLSFAEIAFLGVGFLSIRLTDWKASRLHLILFFLALFLSFYGIAALSFGASAIFTALIFLLALIAFAEGMDEALAALLLFGSLHAGEGGLAFLFILFLIFRARRWRVLSMMLMSLIALLGISFIISGDWFLPFLSSFLANLRAADGLLFSEMLQRWLPTKANLVSQVIKWGLLLLLLLEWRKTREQDFQHLLWTASLSLVLTPFLGVPLKATLYPFLFLPLALIFKTAKDRWQRAEWLIAPLLLLLLSTEIILWKFPQSYSLLAYLYPFLLLIGLYWVRWWIVRPPRTWADQL